MVVEEYDDVNQFLLEDAQTFKGDDRYQLLFRNVGDWGCGDREKGYEVMRFNKDVSFELSQKAINLGFDLFDDFMFRSNYYACYVQKFHTYVIDVKGKLLKCTVALYDEKNRIGTLKHSEIDINNHQLWVNSYEFLPKCEKCQLLLICKGGACPKKEIFQESNFEEKCQRMKQNIMNNFELSILSNKINYELRAE